MFTNNQIFIIGAGGIVEAAHLPAYKKANYNIAGIYDINSEKAKDLATQFSIPNLFNSLQDLTAIITNEAVIDIAVPANEIISILKQLPQHANVLIQKPMGENIEQAKEILSICNEKQLNAAVNFQLRYAPFIQEAKKIIEQENFGIINAIEVNVNVYTPWHLWTFLEKSPRVEILYHSIHYIDLLRYFLGNPNTVFAKTTKHATAAKLDSVRSNIILDYGDSIQVSIHANHCHNFTKEKQHSYIAIEGTNGAILINFGALIDYPNGIADKMEYIIKGKHTTWQTLLLNGTWFPDAFIGSMEQVLLAANKQIEKPNNNVEDAFYSMACVEAAYASSEQGGIKLKNYL